MNYLIDSVEIKRLPGFLHILQVVVHGVLAEGEVGLSFEELDVLLSILHALKGLLSDVRLLAEADLLGHLSNMDWFETLCSQGTNDRDLLLESLEPFLLAVGNAC